ncbi:30S ribosomal protein S6, partial [Vibrio parahaemolyticus]|nr:30S ribosomal protein S6 [Vibrio parahaemolyticus]
MRKYEIMLIFYPDYEEEKRNAVMDRLKGIIETDGKVETIDEWGLRKLAYLINDYAEGYYVLVNFEAGPDIAKELDNKVESGILFSSGLIAGEGVIGILLAVFAIIPLSSEISLGEKIAIGNNVLGQWGSLI